MVLGNASLKHEFVRQNCSKQEKIGGNYKTILITVDSRTFTIRARNVKMLAMIQTCIVLGEM